MIFMPNNNSCHHWRQKLLEIRGGLAQSKYSSIVHNSGHTLYIGVHCHYLYTDFVKNIVILSSPVDQSTVEDGNDVARATHS